MGETNEVHSGDDGLGGETEDLGGKPIYRRLENRDPPQEAKRQPQQGRGNGQEAIRTAR